MPDAIVDVKLALAWIREHIAEYGGDPDRVVVSGGSAGGHLAAMAALTVNDPEYQPGFESADTSVLACVPLYPPTDLARAVRRRRPVDAADRIDSHHAVGVRCRPRVDPERYRHWSPVTLVRPGLVPFLVVQGTGDNLVPYRQTRGLRRPAAAQPGQEVVYVELPGRPTRSRCSTPCAPRRRPARSHRFCSGHRARRWRDELTEGPATPADRGSAARSDDRIDAESTLSERSDDHGAYGAVVSAASWSSTPS